MARFDLSGFGRPPERHHRRLRAIASVVAAASGGLAAMAFAVILVAGVTPAEAPLLWVTAGALVLISLTGLWWRWDSPDARSPSRERERRGY